MLVHKVCSLLLCLTLIIVLAMPVMAESNDSGWIELLEVVSIQDNGENIFRMGSSYTLAIPTPKEMRIRKIDMLIRQPAPHPILTASCTVNTTTTELDVLPIGDNLVRIVGNLPDATYETINIKLGRSGTNPQPFEVLSCKVTPLSVQEFVCDASVYFGGIKYPIDYHIDLSGGMPEHAATSDEFRIEIRDWAKYDHITVWGSADGFSLDSIRASLNTTGLPITVSYMDYNDAGSWTEYVFETDPNHDNALESGASMSTPFYGKYLYCVSIDLSNVDRATAGILLVYMTGHYDQFYGGSFNCQYVNGRVATADTTGLTWWQKFTNFMSSLFDTESDDAEDFKEDAAQKGDEIDDLNNQLQDVTKPPVSDVVTDLDSYIDAGTASTVSSMFGALAGEPLIMSMLMITLTIALVSYILFGKR